MNLYGRGFQLIIGISVGTDCANILHGNVLLAIEPERTYSITNTIAEFKHSYLYHFLCLKDTEAQLISYQYLPTIRR